MKTKGVNMYMLTPKMIFDHFDSIEPLKWNQTTHISNQTYSQPHIPGALCSTLVVLVFLIVTNKELFT